ncbi:glycosyltransferase family 2 protein [Leeia sp. TBRC 13508]|uniref:Glycosyltransferase family 2 protein n=1 Tax=Leeia speluncae TaxID=2884804 RepID=A0ABS8D594_9NEIS|nr:glycosyltransferase family A protein [Leeia speluncae]MCB6182793.1 glycosyltransferase family 2 protein [Leeia speluncae]
MYSLIMPVYNGKKYFEEAIQSAILSLEKDDEIIVVEDGSSDGGVAEIINRQSSVCNISYFKKDNGGVASALNLGIHNAKNENFAWLSHDDMYLPNRFKVDRSLRVHAKNIVTVSNFYLYFNDSKKLVTINNSRKIGARQKIKLLGSRFLNGNCLTAPIELLLSLGAFSENLRHTQDYDLWLKIIEKTNFTSINDATVISRQHADQDSVKLSSAARKEYIDMVKSNLTVADIINPLNFFEILKISKDML